MKLFKSLALSVILSFALISAASATTYGIVGKLQHKNDTKFTAMTQEFNGEIRAVDAATCETKLYNILLTQVNGGASANDPHTLSVIPSTVAHTLQCIAIN